MGAGPVVAVLSPVTGGYYYGGLLAGAAREVAAAGGHLLLLQTLDAGRSGDEVLGAPSFRSRTAWGQVDGVLSLAASTQADHLQDLHASGVPVVMAGHHLDGVAAPTVVPDNAGGVSAAVRHLAGHGHRRIGFVGNLAQTDMRARHDAWAAAMRELGTDPDPAWYFPAEDNHERGGLRAAADVVAAAVPVTAVVVATDRNAMGLLAGLHRSGVDVPGDLAVVGFDDLQRWSRLHPDLTSVSQQFDRLGALAARVLLRALDGEVSTGRHLSPAVLVPRRSCGCGAPGVAPVPSPDSTGGLLPALVEATGPDPDRPATGRAVATLAAALDRAAEAVAADGDVPTAVSDVVSVTSGMRLSAEAVGRVLAVAVAHAAHVQGEEAATDALRRLAGFSAQLTTAMWTTVASSHLDRSLDLETSLGEQYDVSMALLEPHGEDVRTLGWVGATHARLACLALWEGDPAAGRLRVVGTFGREPGSEPRGLIGSPVDVTCFPPAELLRAADPAKEEVTFVIPVRARGNDWGLLAVVGRIDATSASGRVTYNHWAALLTVAFDQEALVAGIRSSEERYALAAHATNDGLWDWDLAEDEIFYSPRCAALLGGDPEGTDPGLWLSAVHPADLPALRASIDRAVEGDSRPFEVELRVLGPDASERWMLCRAVPVGRPGSRATRLIGSLADIDARKRLEEQLRHSALHDPVTGLPNRVLFLQQLAQAVDADVERQGAGPAVLFLDLDGFKAVNDLLGHAAGDQLLVVVARRLLGAVRECDTAARFGGDEFAVRLADVSPADLLDVVERIEQAVTQPVELDGRVVTVGVSIGTASAVDAPGVTAEQLLRAADLEMYAVKAQHRASRRETSAA